jgi:metal-responsive CopG/Arc/MetJ family transcriptional regulator
MKVQVNLSEDMVKRIDVIAKDMGLSRSSLCGVWISQTVYGYDKLFEQTNNAIKTMVNENAKSE